MKILVMGAGAIGSVFGGFLAEKGHDVSFIGRERYIQAVQKDGLRISGIWGEHFIRNIQCFTSVREIGAADFDLILLSTKSFDTEESVQQLLPLIGPATMIVSLQNGLGNIETIARLAGKERTIGARVIFGVVLLAPGHFNITASADKVVLGAVSPDVPAEKVTKIAAVINDAGIATMTTGEIEKFIWKKVLYNCCLNAPAALLDSCYGKLGEFAATRNIIHSIINEVLAVAKECKVDLGFPDAAAYEKVLYEELLPPTYAHHPSTLQDLKNGKKTEIEALNGAIVRLGREKGVATPVNWTLTQLIHGKEGIGPDPC
ncbi:MAG: ketopantoate reductase family protein [Smithellaceae bacterium]